MSVEDAICPSLDQLEIRGEVECPENGCKDRFQNSSRLQMHLVRHHFGGKLENGRGHGKKASFFCPVRDCDRGEGKGKPFPRLGQLKQHFQTVHSNKAFSCAKCGKSFGMRDVCSRHEADCGRTFLCSTCGTAFRTRNALYQHAKRKKHALPDGSKPRCSPPKAQSSTAPTTVVTPIVIRPVVQLPRECKTQDVTTQTEEESHSIIQEYQPMNHPCSIAIASPPHADFSDLGVQTDLTNLLLQFPHTQTRTCQTQPANGCEPFDTHSRASQTHRETHSQACQTPAVSACDFDRRLPHVTQTQPATTDIHELETHSQTSQALTFPATTHEHAFDVQLSQADNSSCELGTQTIGTFNHNGLQSSVDFGTQTVDNDWPLSLIDPEFSPDLLPPECMEFGTQTLESAFIHIPLFDFGMQTPAFSDVKDQGSQT